jgi:hypothetical protein
MLDFNDSKLHCSRNLYLTPICFVSIEIYGQLFDHNAEVSFTDIHRLGYSVIRFSK